MFDEQPDGDPHGECAAEIHRLERELADCMSALPGTYYMDPPDGGDVPVSEQLKRMAKDAARYRHMRENATFQDRNGPGLYWYLPRLDRGLPKGERLDRAIDSAMTSNAGVTGAPISAATREKEQQNAQG